MAQKIALELLFSFFLVFFFYYYYFLIIIINISIVIIIIWVLFSLRDQRAQLCQRSRAKRGERPSAAKESSVREKKRTHVNAGGPGLCSSCV